MLVLSRKVGERIVIGQSITVTVIDTCRGRVRLGVEAPAGVPVNREEVFWRLATHDQQEAKLSQVDPPILAVT